MWLIWRVHTQINLISGRHEQFCGARVTPFRDFPLQPALITYLSLRLSTTCCHCSPLAPVIQALIGPRFPNLRAVFIDYAPHGIRSFVRTRQQLQKSGWDLATTAVGRFKLLNVPTNAYIEVEWTGLRKAWEFLDPFPSNLEIDWEKISNGGRLLRLVGHIFAKYNEAFGFDDMLQGVNVASELKLRRIKDLDSRPMSLQFPERSLLSGNDLAEYITCMISEVGFRYKWLKSTRRICPTGEAVINQWRAEYQ